MDGFQKRLSESIQFKLLMTLVAVILVVTVVAGVFAYMAAFDEAHELQDQVLRQVAELIARRQLSPMPRAAGNPLQDSDEESRVIVQYLGDGNPSLASSAMQRSLPLPSTLPDGLQTVRMATSHSACWSRRQRPVSGSRWRKRRLFATTLPVTARCVR